MPALFEKILHPQSGAYNRAKIFFEISGYYDYNLLNESQFTIPCTTLAPGLFRGLSVSGESFNKFLQGERETDYAFVSTVPSIVWP